MIDDKAAMVQLGKHIGNWGAVLGLLNAWVQAFNPILTFIGTLFGVAWAVLRVWESDTVQEWRRKRKRDEKG